MIDSEGICFVIMPFKPELNYFYLYLKDYIESIHSLRLRCERADDARSDEEAFIDTIKNSIQEAVVVIADCTGSNPNVLYELGMAHAFDKKVIPITQDDPDDLPSDLKHYTFTFYKLNKHVEFLAELTKRLQNLLFERYEALYAQAMAVLHEFKQETHLQVQAIDIETFVDRVWDRDIPSPDEKYRFAFEVLAAIIANDRAPDIQQRTLSWRSTKYGAGD